MQNEIIEYEQDFSNPQVFLKDVKNKDFVSATYNLNNKYFETWNTSNKNESKTTNDWLDLKQSLLAKTPNRESSSTNTNSQGKRPNKMYVYVMGQIIRICKKVNQSLIKGNSLCVYFTRFHRLCVC